MTRNARLPALAALLAGMAVAGVVLAVENASAVATRQAAAAAPAAAARTAAERGRAVYEARCVTCHGVNGKGDGRVARLYNPRPSDLTASTKSDMYKTMIIRKGGAYVGRSLIMPSWEAELSAEEIADVVSYLAVLSTPADAGKGS